MPVWPFSLRRSQKLSNFLTRCLHESVIRHNMRWARTRAACGSCRRKTSHQIVVYKMICSPNAHIFTSHNIIKCTSSATMKMYMISLCIHNIHLCAVAASGAGHAASRGECTRAGSWRSKQAVAGNMCINAQCMPGCLMLSSEDGMPCACRVCEHFCNDP